MKHWFTSDTHFGHTNIIKYCNRPFENIDQMNKKIIDNWNNCVQEDDIVYHLGDFCFKSDSNSGKGQNVKSKEWLSQLKGNIIIIKGNHDKNNSTKTIIHNMTLVFGGFKINLVHNPEHFSHSHDFNLVGHVHNNFKYSFNKDKLCINVGVDVWDFKPITLEQIIKFRNKITREI